MNTFRVRSHSRPEVAKVRADMAGLYRNLRQDRPEMARLLFQMEKEAVKKLTRKILEDYPAESLLA